jgi:alpha-mannosidase
MQQHPEFTRSRVLSYQAQAKLLSCVYPSRLPVELSVYSPLDRVTFAQAIKGTYRPISLGCQLGPVWSTHWFKLNITIPSAWRHEEVHLRWDSSSEACVWQDGVPRQGLTGSDHPASDKPIRTDFVLTKRARAGQRFTLYVEVACNQIIATEGRQEFIGKLRMAEIAVFDRRAWDLVWDMTVIAEMATTPPHNTPRAAQALFTANAMINQIDYDEPATWRKARALAAEFLSARNGDGQHNVHAVGHAHIDTAWLWPLAETKRKCYRTFSSALRNMEKYPEFKFACSQAQQYEWIKVEQPKLYTQIKTQVAKGNFIPVGGTWIEPDCNLPSGESLVRQFLVGQRFFEREFGVLCNEFWNPDVFGYTAQLPQIMRGCGIDRFLTQKLSQNEFNKPASQSFWWQGLDGSRVFTHFPPADSYLGNCSVAQLQYHVQNYKELDRSNDSLYLFGFGDGGGGPTTEMLERLRRARDVDGLPRVTIISPKNSLPRVRDRARSLTTHVGEMYFESHRGTYTSQAGNKRDNRRAEELLHDVELLAATSDSPYPKRELDRLWKIVLLNQFHDIIPGCSILQVHQESARQYAEVLGQGAAIRQRLITRLSGKPGRNILAINTLSEPRREVVQLPGDGGKLAIVSAPAMGYAIQEPSLTVDEPARVTENRGQFTLENSQIRAVFRTDGTLTSLTHKSTGRETIDGNANRFVLYGDQPVCYDAWNADVSHLEKRRDLGPAKSARVVQTDLLEVAIEFTFAISSQSHIRQRVSLSAIAQRLEFDCHVDWHETQKFLKVEFPTTLRSDEASYEIQFGHVRRPTHFNNRYDLARFEVCAHRWADLSEPDFGLALLNDCKYGYATHGKVMRLSLLRSPKYPDATADMGEHRFRYALLPHAGAVQQADVVHEARRFNCPMQLRSTSKPIGERSWFTVDNPAVVLDTVKRAEEGNSVVLRLYESSGCESTCSLTSFLPVKSVTRCDMLERDERQIPSRKGYIRLMLKPFEIVTLKLEFHSV